MARADLHSHLCPDCGIEWDCRLKVCVLAQPFAKLARCERCMLGLNAAASRDAAGLGEA